MEPEAQYKNAIQDGKPRIGIWWSLPSGKLLVAAVPLEEGTRYGEFINHEEHASFWERAQRSYPEIRGHEYDRINRGRVLYGPNGFRILASHASLSNRKLLERIRQEFGLVGQRVELIPDAHYEIPR